MDSRIHWNRSLADLGKMAFGILHTFFSKAAEHGLLSIETELGKDYIMVRQKGNEYFVEGEERSLIHRPPMITVDQYREKRGLPVEDIPSPSR
jgi:glucosyl-3-phosphoglycerate synthase